MIASKRKGRGMATGSDLWYIRLPDGRVLHARSTEALRRYLKRGRLPWAIRVRRSADDPWQTLDRTPQFADLLPAESEPEAHTAPSDQATTPVRELHAVGVRGVLEELVHALDTSLHRAKLMTTAMAGLGMGITLLIADRVVPRLGDWEWAGLLGAGMVSLLLFSICASILTQMTSLELSRSRSALFSEIRAGLFGYILRLTCVLGLIGGLMLGLILLLRALPGWIGPDETGGGSEVLLNVLHGTRWLLEVVCGPILALAMLLMGPILIVEDHSIWQGLREWLSLLWKHLGRVYLYQAIAFAVAAVMTLPLMLPIVLVGGRPTSLSEAAPFYLLSGLALTPGLAYLLVAHVFLYLNLRYEFFHSARER
jgi:hypothetical protein